MSASASSQSRRSEDVGGILPPMWFFALNLGGVAGVTGLQSSGLTDILSVFLTLVSSGADSRVTPVTEAVFADTAVCRLARSLHACSTIAFAFIRPISNFLISNLMFGGFATAVSWHIQSAIVNADPIEIAAGVALFAFVLLLKAFTTILQLLLLFLFGNAFFANGIIRFNY